MLGAGKPVDLITLAEELRQHGQLNAVGGHAYICSLTDGVPPRPSIDYYAATIRKAAGQSYAVHAANALIAAAIDGEGITELNDRLTEVGKHIANYQSGSIIDLTRFPDPLELPTDPEVWLVPGIVLKSGITEMAGAPGEGKTWQALAIARAVAFRNEYLGRRCGHAEVVILDYENPKTVIQSRWETMFSESVRKYGITLWAAWSGMGDVPKVGDPRLMALAKPGRLLIFDTLSGAHAAKDENSASEMTPIMAQFRALANQGTSILLLHHRGKNELSKYRGSSAIAAGVDVACSLIKSDDGFLTLDVFKSRGTAEFKLTIQPDYATGNFEVVDSPAVTHRRDDIGIVSEIISRTPGLSQNQIFKEARMGRTALCSLLKANDGRSWKSERGLRGSLCYFPVTCTEYRPVPSTTGTTHLTCTPVPTPLGVVQSTGRTAGVSQ